jgi:hypothetical protein
VSEGKTEEKDLPIEVRRDEVMSIIIIGAYLFSKIQI